MISFFARLKTSIVKNEKNTKNLFWPVRKLPEANDKIAKDSKKIDGKKSIFFDFLQIVPDGF
jgi:hypothetical protein